MTPLVVTVSDRSDFYCVGTLSEQSRLTPFAQADPFLSNLITIGHAALVMASYDIVNHTLRDVSDRDRESSHHCAS